MLRFEAPDEELFRAIKPFLQDLFPDSFLSEQIRLLGDTAFSYAYREGTMSREDFRKYLCSWFERMAELLSPVSIRSLTRRQKRFIEAYLECDGNGAEAARRAGYSEGSARKIASRLLKNSKIRKQLEDRRRRDRPDGEL